MAPRTQGMLITFGIVAAVLVGVSYWFSREADLR